MNIVSLIIGESGTGKSASLMDLVPSSTFIINVLNKPLPFRGFTKKYTKLSIDMQTGNYFASDKYDKIIRVIKHINQNRPEITTIVVDDFQYVMGNEFVSRCHERGFDKFSEIQQHAWLILNHLNSLRDDMKVFVLSHSEINAEGKAKAKTIGKMLDEKITIEGMFTIVLHSLIVDDEYKFLTNNDGSHIAKSPMGMFVDKLIPNNLQKVLETIDEYFDDCDPDLYKPNPIAMPVLANAAISEEQLDKITVLCSKLNKNQAYINTILKKANVESMQQLTNVFAEKWISSLLPQLNKEG